MAKKINMKNLSEETKKNLKNALEKTLERNSKLFIEETIKFGYRKSEITSLH